MLKKIGIILLLLSPLLANAASFSNAEIGAVRPDNWQTGGIFIRLQGTRSGTLSCNFPNGEGNDWYFIRLDNPLMDQLLSVALSAKMAAKKVTVIGNGICTEGYEGVRYIQLND